LRELRVMQLLFYRPLMKSEMSSDHNLATALFPSLDKVIQVHGQCLECTFLYYNCIVLCIVIIITSVIAIVSYLHQSRPTLHHVVAEIDK